MAKSDRSMFIINRELLVYKAFYFFFLGGFGSVFPYLPVYFRQIGLTADQVGLIVGMRPIVQFASAPFWAIMADKFRKRKAVLVMSVLSWLIMTLALAFVEPTNEICELRVSNATHTHFVNYTKVKTGFFRRSLLSYDRDLEYGADVETSPDLVVVPMDNDDESTGWGSGSGKQTSAESPQLHKFPIPFQTQLFSAISSDWKIPSSIRAQPAGHMIAFQNSSKANGTKSNKAILGENRTFLHQSDSRVFRHGKRLRKNSTKKKLEHKDGLSNLHNGAKIIVESSGQASELLVPKSQNNLTAAERIRVLHKSYMENVSSGNDTLSQSDNVNQRSDSKHRKLLVNVDPLYNDLSGSGQIIDDVPEKKMKSKRHNMVRLVPAKANAQNGNSEKSKSDKKQSKDLNKRKKGAPVVIDFSRFLPDSEQKIRNNINGSSQTIGFQSQRENENNIELNSGVVGSTLENAKKFKNDSNNTNNATLKHKLANLKELTKLYGFLPSGNSSIVAFDKIVDKTKNSILDLKGVLEHSSSYQQKNVSEDRTSEADSSNRSSANSVQTAKINIQQATIAGADVLHEGDNVRAKKPLLHHGDKLIQVPLSAFSLVNSSFKSNNSFLLSEQIDNKADKIARFLLEKTREQTKGLVVSSGENSGASEEVETDESSSTFVNTLSKITELPLLSSSTSDILHQLKITTKNLLKTNPIELKRIFIILMILIVVGEFLEAPSFTLADAALLEHLGEERRYYGKQRLWGSLGFGIFSFIVGILLEKSRHTVCGEPYTDYMICFCVFAVLMILTLFTSTKFQFEYNNTPRAGTSVLSALCNVHYGSCLMAACFMGFGHGMSHNFINWFLEDLGGTKTLMGVAVICRCLADLSMFFIAGFVIKLVGQIKIMFVALVCYGVIFTSYSLLENSWSVLPIELLNGMTYAAAWSACTSYMAGASTADAVTTIQGILQGVYWGLGSGSGAITGGLMIHHIGAVATFRFTAGGFFLICLLFGLAQWRWGKETADRPPQTKYTYLPATPEGKDMEALLSGYFTKASKTLREGTRSYQNHY